MTKLGAYTGTTPTTLAAYEAWLGRPLDDVLVSINQTGWDAFDGSIDWDVSQWKPTGREMIWSVPLTVSGTSLEQTATGAFNAHYLKAAQALVQGASGSQPIYVRVGWEFNIPGQPWAAQGHEQAFIQSYKNLADTFRSVSDRFKFVWDPNIGGSYNPALAYPGDKYVDVVGADMYYNPEWDGSDPRSAFQLKVAEKYGLQWQQDFAAAHDKPTAVSEWSVNTSTSGPFIAAAQQWFTAHKMLYANYWESNAAYNGELHSGEHGSAGGAYQQAFGASAAKSSATSGSAGSATLPTGGALIMDLPGGFFKQGGVRVSLANTQSVQTGSAATTVYGLRSGNDTILGGSGALTVYGQGGNDSITSGTGDGTIYGASGRESFVSGGGRNIMYGGSGTNSMVGGSIASSVDTFYGKGGTDTVTAKAGSMTLYAGSGKTTLNGGSGTSTIFTGAGTNTITGGTGKTVIYGGSGDQAGVNIEYAGPGATLLYEGSGTDYFATNDGTCSIYGGSGKSFVYGGTGSQTIYTGAGNQYVSCGGGTTAFFETLAHMTAGRHDQIDGFWGAKATDIYLPSAVAGKTWFAGVSGGTSIVTAVSGGNAQLFVSGVDASTLAAHTHFV